MRSIACGKFSDSALGSRGAALEAPCPGYGFTAVCDPVARTDAQHRLRETVRRVAPMLPGQPQLLEVAVQL
ncbi:hypothetical protein [Klebsiella grimontii]|uniref:hypothetical protein n=1 Tax=Klebsiella grimontii TaxID=2058152 RepID=UPI00224428FF|nr:hypothetical protein [Klebsiella grimontii]